MKSSLSKVNFFTALPGKRVLALFIVGLVFPSALYAQYSTDVLPRPEHPKPQFKRSAWLNLNGEWNFAMDPKKAGLEKGWNKNPQSLGREITVPFPPESKLSGIEHTDFMPQVWYHRTVDIPDKWKGNRIFLKFGAVDYEARVWVNGEQVGRHNGGSVSFEFEITDALESGENDIVVMARDEIRTSIQPSGKQSFRKKSSGVYYTRVTGIWQTVWLEARPKDYIESVRTIPRYDEGGFTFIPNFEGATRNHQFRVTVRDEEGRQVASTTTSATNGTPVSINLENPQAWDLNNPYLYSVNFKLLDGGKQLDQVDSYAGLRKFHIEDNTFYLNNEPIFLRFVLDQGYYPDGLWTAPSDEALKGDIKRAMKVGFNGARLHQKVFEERFHYWADKLGYLTWGEFVDWGSFEFRSLTNPEALRNIRREWAEVVQRDWNHPSIISWVPLNETTFAARKDVENYRKFARSMYDLTETLDPTRPINDASGYVHVTTDIYTIHDYDQQAKTFRERYSSVSLENPQDAWRGYSHQKPKLATPYKDQPYVVDEYGGTFWTTAYTDQPKKAGENRGNWGYGKTADQVEDKIEELTDVLLQNLNIAGFTYTQLTDIEQEVNGIYTYDRELKFDAERLREIFRAPAAIIQEKQED